MKNTTLMICFIAALAIFASPVIAAQDIGGRWYHDGKPTSISVSSGGSVTITDEHGKKSGGHLTGSDLFMQWLGIRGVVSDGGRRISWSNGTTWTREPHSDSGHGVGRGLNGRWFHDGRPTNISVSSDGRSVTITNEHGQSSSGSMSGNEIVIGGLRGHVSHGEQRISWNNGTEWRR